MKIKIMGRDKEDIDLLTKRSKKVKNIKIDEKNPEIIITFGGDGSFLVAERKYPGIPKLILRHKSVCKKCHDGKFEDLLEKLFKGEYEIKKYPKIEAKIKKGENIIKKIGANDIVVSNRLPYRALRFKLKINNKEIEKEFIGDGVVASTGFGSTGYFHSITRKNFNTGFGLAFNNLTEKTPPVFFNNSTIKLDIFRNDAYVSSDNDDNMVIIKEGDSVEIKKSNKEFKIINIKIPEAINEL